LPGPAADDIATQPPGAARFPRLKFSSARARFVNRRARLLAAIAVVLLGGLGYLGYCASKSAVGWLHVQPQYQIPFDRIELVTAPPDWYRGGSRAFVEQVRRADGKFEAVPLLDVSPERIATAFKKCAWVEDVIKVDFRPDAIRVWLRYAQPVALVVLAHGERHFVDEKGALLPGDDIDLDRLGQVAQITGDDTLKPPVKPQPGMPWKKEGDSSGVEQDDDRIAGAARLASLIRKKAEPRTVGRTGSLRIVEIMVNDYDHHGLFLVNGEGAIIWWSAPPGKEQPGQATADEKWEMLREWAQKAIGATLPPGDYWAFFKDGLRPICPHGDPLHRREAAPKKPSDTKPNATPTGRSG
jgi:hypothetical protein